MTFIVSFSSSIGETYSATNHRRKWYLTEICRRQFCNMCHSSSLQPLHLLRPWQCIQHQPSSRVRLIADRAKDLHPQEQPIQSLLWWNRIASYSRIIPRIGLHEKQQKILNFTIHKWLFNKHCFSMWSPRIWYVVYFWLIIVFTVYFISKKHFDRQRLFGPSQCALKDILTASSRHSNGVVSTF